MTEPVVPEGAALAPASDSPPAGSAGTLLRQAREAQGLHIAALAAALKVPQRKLEALERDQWDELPDATFTRALAQAVCRTLKTDPAPVLALLPRTGQATLDQVTGGLNTPFRERPSAIEPSVTGLATHPATWIVALLLVAALAVVFWPQPSVVLAPLAASAPAASAPDPTAAIAAAASEPEPMIETVHSAPPDNAATAASAPPAAVVHGPLTLRTNEPSWIEVVDAGGRPLLARLLQPGETVGLDGAMPLRLTIGNASATEIAFRGNSVDLAPYTRDNVARLELK
jgi:cytoskeleton protein RodZ